MEEADHKFREAVSYALKFVGGKKRIDLREQQAEALRAVYNLHDAFLWLPTGFGKSICYECLPFMFDYKLDHKDTSSRHTVLVISPLISLMMDQVASLRNRKISAAMLSKTDCTDKSFLASEKDLLVPGKYSILFSSPEAIVGASKWRDLLLSAPLSERIVALAVDEAHCVSKW